MKRTVLIFLVLLVGISSFAQLYNTAGVMKKKDFSIGVHPTLWNNNFVLFANAGIGLGSGIDLGIRYGIFDGTDYLGADFEWAVIPKPVQLSAGAGLHYTGIVGIDGNLVFSFPIQNVVEVYTGLDANLEFANDIFLLVWVPIGLEAFINNRFSLMIEGDIPIDGFTIFGGGVNFYF